MADNSAIEKCKDAAMLLGFSNPHFMLIHSKISYVEAAGQYSGIGTMGITSSGKIIVNKDFVSSTPKDKLQGVIAHELMHLVLSHHDRKGGRDPWVWNIANDMIINRALENDKIPLPDSAVKLPHEYQGDLFSETLFDWLLKNPQHVPPKPPEPEAGAGCGTIDDGQQPQQDWRQVGAEAKAIAEQAGKGSGGFLSVMKPRQPKIDWKKVLRHGFQQACARPGRDYQTFAKRHRRSPAVGPQFPGWLGSSPRISVVVDVSGSMNRKFVEKIVSEIKNLLKEFPNTSCYLVTHTDRVCWADWVEHSTKARVEDAVQFSGGTDPTEAYLYVEKQGKFDSMVHFTDCEFFQENWPELPGGLRRGGLVIGGFTREPYTKPPKGSTYIPCDMSLEDDEY